MDQFKTIDVSQFRRQKPPLRALGGILAVVIVAALLLTSFFQIAPEEVGVVLRFGEYVREVQPGLNFKLPAPIETVEKVAVERQEKEEFGFRTERAAVRTQYSSGNFSDEALMLTGDLNVAVVEWTTQFRVRTPYDYLFKVHNIRDTFRAMNEAIMRAVIGDRSVNEVITVGRQEIASEVEIRLQELCDRYETGIVVEQIVLQNVNPPDPVKPSFNEVNEAEQERERAINEARADYNRIIPRASGEALETIQQAEGYAIDRVNRAKGDVAAFEALLLAYRRSPEVTRRRLYLETLDTVYSNAGKTVVIDDDLDGLLPLLQLNEGGAK